MQRWGRNGKGKEVQMLLAVPGGVPLATVWGRALSTQQAGGTLRLFSLPVVTVYSGAILNIILDTTPLGKKIHRLNVHSETEEPWG